MKKIEEPSPQMRSQNSANSGAGFRLTIFLIASLALCLLTIVSSLEVIRVSSTSLPYWDSFGMYPVTDVRFSALIARHNEHVVGTMRLFFKLDEYLTRHQGYLTLAAIFGSLLFSAGMLALQLGRCSLDAAKAQGIAFDNRFRWLLLAVFMTLAASAVQFTNIVWQFQICFVGAFTFSLIALLLFTKGLESRGIKAFALTALAFVAGTAAAYGLFSGVLVWPAFVAIAIAWRKFGRAYLAVLLGLIVCAPYFSSAAKGQDFIGQIMAMPPFFLVFLGSPIGSIFEANSLNINVGIAQLPVVVSMVCGALMLAAAAFLCFLTLREVRRRNLAASELIVAASCVTFCGMIIATAGLVAIGRSKFSLQEAMTSRYTTPCLLLICCLLSLWIWLAWRNILPRRGLVASLLLIQILFLAGQPHRLAQATAHGTKIAEAEAAVMNQVNDPQDLKFLYPILPKVMHVFRDIWVSRVSLFSGKPINADLGQSVSGWERIDADCSASLREGRQVHDTSLGFIQDRMRWIANVTKRAPRLVNWQLRTASKNLIVGIGAPETRASGQFSYPDDENLIIYGPKDSDLLLVHPKERRYARCGSRFAVSASAGSFVQQAAIDTPDRCEAGFIDAINGAPPTSAISKSGKILAVNGWLAASGKEGIAADEIFVSLSDANKVRRFYTAGRVSRPDVAAFLKKPNMRDTGFTLQSDISELKGIYELNLAWKRDGILHNCRPTDMPLLISAGESQ